MTTPPYPVAKVTGECNCGTSVAIALPNTIGAELLFWAGYPPDAGASDASQSKAASR